MTLPLSTSTRSLCDLSHTELVEWCAAHDQPAYRAAQIRQWLFEKRADRYETMHNLPKGLRVALTEELPLFSANLVNDRVATDRTEKLLLELHDGQHIEAVLMREPDRRTVCLSTQVGCAMGCVFCASGLLGLNRNLSTGEIVEQVLRIDRLLEPDERLTNVVVMGIGEPLANLKALLPALETFTNDLGLGARRITISTVGLPDRMRELAEAGRAFNLAVSLHAPNDALRNELVPVNDRIGIDAILRAADEYFERTGRRVTYEYVLLGGINDKREHARELAAVLKGRNAHVNLIPMNDVDELPFHAPQQPRTRAFVAALERAGVTTTVRKRKGADVDAACGQLRIEQERRQTPGSARVS